MSNNNINDTSWTVRVSNFDTTPSFPSMYDPVNLPNIVSQNHIHSGSYILPYTSIGTDTYIYSTKDDTISVEKKSTNEKDFQEKNKIKMSPTTVIKNRAHIFRSFLSVIEKNRSKFIKESGFDFPESDPESKKRCRFWAGNLFGPVQIYVKKILYISALDNGENDMQWKDVNSIQTLTPIGIDIWGTVGGFAQKEEIDWGKALLTFVPSSGLMKIMKNNIYPVCFTTSFAIEIPRSTPPEKTETLTRTIEYDLE